MHISISHHNCSLNIWYDSTVFGTYDSEMLTGPDVCTGF